MLTSNAHRRTTFRLPSVPFVLLIMFLATLWLAGGAARGDALGQAVVRSVAWLVVVVMLLASPGLPSVRAQPVAILMLCAVALPLAQLVPLPPELWHMLPGRQVFTQVATLSGQPQPWRPWSNVPGATVNALASLIVPFATWLLATSLNPHERRHLPGLLLCVVVATMFVGLLQFSGMVFDNPFVNDTVGEVSGTFANRNHFALFMGVGCLLAPTWGLSGERLTYWRLPAVIILLILLLLTILGSGSRAGFGIGVIALLLGVTLSGQKIRKALALYPRWIYPVLVAAFVVVVFAFVSLSVMADRAESINRIFMLNPGQDMRAQALPTVWTMVQAYFPFGSGLGGFDPMFRMHEPFILLQTLYFNHAHNDWLEVLLDAGLPGLLLLLAAIGWWARTSLRAWGRGAGPGREVAKLGSATIFLAMVASLFDYPARTPMIMAVIVIAGLWLSETPRVSPLPRRSQLL